MTIVRGILDVVSKIMITEIKNNEKLLIKFINDDIGWGVFTNSKIEKGEIVEYCRCILDNYYTSSLKDYTFRVNMESQDSYHCFGYGPIYNHSNDPNIVWMFDNNNGYSLIIFKALRDIDAGEELRHNYGPGYWEFRKNKKLI